MDKAYSKAFAAIKLAKKYHETGDEAKARQAAICLARLGLQNASHGFRQTMRTYDMIPGVIHGDAAFRQTLSSLLDGQCHEFIHIIHSGEFFTVDIPFDYSFYSNIYFKSNL